MAGSSTLDALQHFHRELSALCERKGIGGSVLADEWVIHIFEAELSKLWDRPLKKEASRTAVKSGKIVVGGEEYSINDDFQQNTLSLADEIDLDELEAARCLLESQGDIYTLGRPLLECGIIRYHQQRKYLLDSARLLLDLDRLDEDNYDDEDSPQGLDEVRAYAESTLIRPNASGPSRTLCRCLETMTTSRTWLQRLTDKFTAAHTIGSTGPGRYSEELETVEFSRVSLLQQHELLAIILCRCIEKRTATKTDFIDFISVISKLDKYDSLLIHLIPALGAYISLFGSTEGGYDLVQARQLNEQLFSPYSEICWSFPSLKAAARAWWLAEYSGFYLDDPPESSIPNNTDLDAEDRQRSKHFLDTLKDGAFDLILSIAGDVKSRDWHDPVRTGMNKWLRRKSPALITESAVFSDDFQNCLMGQLEVFIDAFISNLPDVLRKLRTDEDEQRQLSQAHEQDLDLERFLFIIAYSYEGRPEAATNFWTDPDSNLAGFMHWASRRASTPLVTAFCEMLSAISGTETCASAAHDFLLDEGHHSSGKMGRFQSLTWSQIFKELTFFSEKIRQGPKPAATTTTRYRSGKPANEYAETEPESAMMLECYLRLITKLATTSELSRQFFLQNEFNVVAVLFELASGPIPPRLRGCIFSAVGSLVTRKSLDEGHMMWTYLDLWLVGGYVASTGTQQRLPQQSPITAMNRTLGEMCQGFDDPDAFVSLLVALICPAMDSSPLNDALPFPENLGSSVRVPGIEVYVDYVLGLVFASKTSEPLDGFQTRALRLSCLEFMLACLSTFNENLIVMANETNIAVDAVLSTTDLATYVTMHPFARVMEWMLNEHVMTALFDVLQQDAVEVGNASPDSPLVLSILRGVEIISRVLDMQATYLNLVRPIVRNQSSQLRQPMANAAYSSLEDGLATRVNLVVCLGNYCGIGHPPLTLACLKLLERLSSSAKISAIWSDSGRQTHRNKAIVALEAHAANEVIARSFISELVSPLEVGQEPDSPEHATIVYILDFLYHCLRETPNKPTIAHLLLGFKCDVDSLSVDNDGPFASQTSLFHTILRLLFETPSTDSEGMRHWLLTIKTGAMRILCILWKSPLSAPLVVEELRVNEFVFHLLVREAVIQPDLPWEGHSITSPDFTLTKGAAALVDFLELRSMSFEYIAMELCVISQARHPSLKRRILEALNGQVVGDDNERISIPTFFDLFDFLIPPGLWDHPDPPLEFYSDLDFSASVEVNALGTFFNITRAQEYLILRRNELQKQGTMVAAADLIVIEREEAMIVQHLTATNRQRQVDTQSLKVLKSWARLLLVMTECNDFKGTAQTSFFLQALQTVLPSLEAFASEQPEEALELANLTKVLLFKLDLASSSGEVKNNHAIGHLISEKLYQLFQTCLQAIGKWAGTGNPRLRSVYYEICYRYLTGTIERGSEELIEAKALKTIHVYGERLTNVICEDVFCGDPPCQTSALILLNAIVATGRRGGDIRVIDTLNKLNFIGVLIDSLRNIMTEWHSAYSSGNIDEQNHQNARLALILQLAQTREGAKNILHSNLFHTISVSGLFTADPELQIDTQHRSALEHHYHLLALVVRVIGAAILSRGSSNISQGRKFLSDHRMLITHVLKRCAGIGGSSDDDSLAERLSELGDGLMVIMIATGFVESENEAMPETKQQDYLLFH